MSSPLWACGAAGSALPWHGRGHRFDPGQVHQSNSRRIKELQSPVSSERNKNKGTKKAHQENTALCDARKNQKAHRDDRWAFLLLPSFSACLIYDEQARDVLLSCSFVLVVRLSVDVQRRPAVGMAHQLLHHLYPLTLLHQ
jgi:hypothetical protein